MLQDLYQFRKKANLTQRDLAKLSGVSKTTIFQIESGQVIPRADTICLLAYALSMEPGELFTALINGEDYAMKGDS